jgi:glycosyltransferase involved in cell wall biosynthesis
VCTGRIYAPHWPAVDAEVRAAGLGEQVRFVGPVPDGILTVLYRCAHVMVFPSLFEGLGLPLLEAMEHDLPIVAAASTCIPEVAGDVARLVDGESVEALTRALLEAMKHPEDPAAVRARRREVLARYSWDDAIRTFTACYRAAAGWPLSDEQRHRLARATGT